jgi:hypothetical protein
MKLRHATVLDASDNKGYLRADAFGFSESET